MKKLIAILVVFAVVAGAAFAQVPTGMFLNAWGQGAFVPIMIQTPELYAGEKGVGGPDNENLGARMFVGTGPEWGWNDKISAQFNVGGSSEGIGWSVNVPVHDAITGNIWAKPFNGSDAFKITIGNYTDDTLRGSQLAGRNGDALLPSFGMGRDDIFSRLGTDADGCLTRYANVGGAKTGFLFTSVPVNGLFLGWNVNTSNTLNLAGPREQNRRANDAFRHSQAAIGYNIGSIGLVRAMYLGGWGGKIDQENEKTMKKYDRADGATNGRPDLTTGALTNAYDQASLQLAFRLTAIEGITIDLGYRVFIPVTIWKDPDGEAGPRESEKLAKSSHGHSIAGNVAMNFGNFNLGIFAGAKFGAYTGRDVNEKSLEGKDYDKDKKRDGLALNVRIDPSISLDFGTIGFMLAYNMKGSTIVWSEEREKFDGKNADGKYTGYAHNIGMGLWYERSIGSGTFTVALTYTMPTLRYDAESEKAKFNGSHWIMLPVTLTYAFF